MSLYRCFPVIIACLFLRVGVCDAEDRDRAQLESGSTPRILVLTSGQMIVGELRTRSDGYDVLKPGGGRVFVASPEIRFEATDPDDAYRKMRRSLPELTPGLHVQLARWCIANELHEQASRELLDALYLDPNREEARQILQMIVRRQRSGRLPAGDSADATAVSDGARSAAAGPGSPLSVLGRPPLMETRSLGGLSKSSAQAFVQRIQPVLTSRCISCHSAGTNSFTLISTRNGSTPLIAERNLAVVLQYVDPGSPDASPLLRAATDSHGGGRDSAQRGRLGRAQADALREWIRAVSRERSGNELNPLHLVDREPAEAKRTGAASPQADSESPTAGTGRLLTKDENDARVLNEMRFRNRKDPFDPDVFNRKYHFAGISVADETSENSSSARGTSR